MRSLIPILVAPLFLAGCASYDLSALEAFADEVGVDSTDVDAAVDRAESVEDTVLGNAVKPMPYYCKVPAPARDVFRSRINRRPEAQGAQIAVWCPGDPPVTLDGS